MFSQKMKRKLSTLKIAEGNESDDRVAVLYLISLLIFSPLF